MRNLGLILGVAVAALLAAVGCGRDLGPTGSERGLATLSFEVQAPGFVRLVSVQVTGPGIDSLLAFNITVDSTGHGSGSIRIPAGSGRLVVGRAFDAAGVNTHRGDTTLTLQEGTNPSVALLLRPLVGTQPIVITVGTPRIALQPGDTTLYVSGTLTLIATVRDSTGAVVSGAPVEWATTNPAVATVDAGGVVVGRTVGVVTIVAMSGAYAVRRPLSVVLQPPDSTATVVALATGRGPSSDRSCAVTSAHEVVCWGSNEWGLLGTGSAGGTSSTPVRVASALLFAAVATGAHHSCALTTIGEAYCWGQNSEGQLGDGSVTDRYLPTRVVTSLRFSRIDAGDTHTCALTTAGRAYCWGDNDNASLGDSSVTDRLVPAAVWGGQGFAEISAGAYATFAVDSAGRMWCWGSGPTGGCWSGVLVPVTVYPALPVVHGLSLGENNWCVLGPAGQSYCTYPNGTGNLTTGAVSAGPAFVAVSTGNSHDYYYGHACGVTAAGALYCWGTNSSGQAGPGTATIAAPVLVPSTVSFVAVSANAAHTCVLGSDGHAYCMGWNAYGQLGDGSTTNRNTPTLVRVR